MAEDDKTGQDIAEESLFSQPVRASWIALRPNLTILIN